MKLEHLVGDRFKERPADCVVDSHALMARGGYMKPVSNGIYSSYLPLRRITRKIEEIIREEMDGIDGQEVQFPVVLPASLWRESGRYESVGRELARFRDRNGVDMVLGMTHEEAAVQLVRDYAQTYTKYPFMIYQIQTKFRDEARPRAGLIRVREFTMKDGYSFHTSQEDLDAYYLRCLQAYHRIYARVGIGQVIDVASDSGMMGGNLSHEFMLLTPVGEDTIVQCPHCGYRANMETVPSGVHGFRQDSSQELRLVPTPHQSTIEELCRFLGVKEENCCKAVVYQREEDNGYVVLFLRGDLEVNETKLTRYLGGPVRPAVITQESGLVAGYIGPYGLKGDFQVFYDQSLSGANQLCCGGNREGYHYTGLDFDRDLPHIVYGDFSKVREGDPCPHCGKPGLTVSRGIEVGNIFQLGTKYTQSMGMTYTDQEGKEQFPLMGCYGIGVGRLAASVCEANHDDYGPIWPVSIAPWQVHLCAVRSDHPQVAQYGEELYQGLQNRGVEVIYDDRKVSTGVMFADADLLGVPVRAVISPRNWKRGILEVTTRDKSYREEIPLENGEEELFYLVERLQRGEQL